jgi:transcriptional regulator with XRE-family HTH domain
VNHLGDEGNRPPEAPPRRGVALRPEYLEFAERLREAMQREGLNASDVARRVWGEIKDRRGYLVARNRDRIGYYLAGVSFPEEENLRKLADAVGLSYEALAVTKPLSGPSSSSSTSGVGFGGGTKSRGMLDTQLAILSNKRAVLALKREMKLDTALKIIELLKAEDEAEAGDGHDPAASPHSE